MVDYATNPEIEIALDTLLTQVEQRAKEEERENIAKWIESMNEPTTNIMTVASRNEIVLILRRLKTVDGEALINPNT